MNIPKPFGALILVSLLTSSLRGGVIPGRWEKVDGLEPGSKIVLTSEAGDRVRYTFQKSDPTSVTVKDRNGRELVIAKGHITKIVKQNPRSSKPAWIAAAIGTGVGVAMGAGIRSDEYPQAKWGIAAVGLGALGAAIGFTSAYLVTKDPPDELIYEAPVSQTVHHNRLRLE